MYDYSLLVKEIQYIKYISISPRQCILCFSVNKTTSIKVVIGNKENVC